MKNLIEPEKLQALKSQPISHEVIAKFLESEPKVSVSYICRTLGIAPTSFYSWRSRRQKSETRRQAQLERPPSEVTPTGAGKRNYSAEDKVALVRDYQGLSEEKRGSFLRTYGLYHSDLERWREVIEQAAVEALSKRKQGRAAKNEDQVKIEELQKELVGQEKVIAKLSAIVVVQKKISTILGISEVI